MNNVIKNILKGIVLFGTGTAGLLFSGCSNNGLGKVSFSNEAIEMEEESRAIIPSPTDIFTAYLRGNGVARLNKIETILTSLITSNPVAKDILGAFDVLFGTKGPSTEQQLEEISSSIAKIDSQLTSVSNSITILDEKISEMQTQITDAEVNRKITAYRQLLQSRLSTMDKILSANTIAINSLQMAREDYEDPEEFKAEAEEILKYWGSTVISGDTSSLAAIFLINQFCGFNTINESCSGEGMLFNGKSYLDLYDDYAYLFFDWEHEGYAWREGIRAFDQTVILQTVSLSALYAQICSKSNSVRKTLTKQLISSLDEYKQFAAAHPVIHHDDYRICQIPGAEAVYVKDMINNDLSTLACDYEIALIDRRELERHDMNQLYEKYYWHNWNLEYTNYCNNDVYTFIMETPLCRAVYQCHNDRGTLQNTITYADCSSNKNAQRYDFLREADRNAIFEKWNNGQKVNGERTIEERYLNKPTAAMYEAINARYLSHNAAGENKNANLFNAFLNAGFTYNGSHSEYYAMNVSQSNAKFVTEGKIICKLLGNDKEVEWNTLAGTVYNNGTKVKALQPTVQGNVESFTALLAQSRQNNWTYLDVTFLSPVKGYCSTADEAFYKRNTGFIYPAVVGTFSKKCSGSNESMQYAQLQELITQMIAEYEAK